MASSSSKTPVPQTRRKRILPSRSRRGGPGVGSCDVDQMILETYKRQAENEPLIPASTRFLLTTDTSQVASPSSSSSSHPSSSRLRLNLAARDRYFDRPEVIKAYKEQLTIQTPEFTSLSEDASVGGRFRPRGAEDSGVDTSDQAYEKRHRKYETFEKRQRLREKEKLKHEQYKLKERIEQLRAMDGAAFMSLPASTFTPPPSAGSEGLPGAHVNGAAAYNEGERRRREMLDVALSLEERYRILLPPDRLKKSSARARTASEADVIASEINAEEEVDELRIEPEVESHLPKETEKLKLKIRFPARSHNHSPQTVTPSTVQPPASFKKTKPVKPASTTSAPQAIEASSPSSTTVQAEEQPSELSSVRIIYAASPAYSNPEIAILEDNKSRASAGPIEKPRLIDRARPSKRLRSSIASSHKESSLPPIESISVPVTAKRSTPKPDVDHPKSLLLLTAIRQSEMPKSRKTQRHHLPFGFKVPLEVEEHRDFELPDWIKNIRDVDNGSEYPPTVHDQAHLAHIKTDGHSGDAHAESISVK